VVSAAAEPDEENLVEVLAVSVGGAQFGLPVERVTGVIRVPSITRLPFPPPDILGVASVRGTLVPVLDLGARLLRRPASRHGRVVLVEEPSAGQPMGLLVDSVVGLVSGTPGTGAIPPEIEASLPNGWVAGILAAEADDLTTLLELEPVLAASAPTDKEQR
jgi:purine-binding chemotaxis protein CheW